MAEPKKSGILVAVITKIGGISTQSITNLAGIATTSIPGWPTGGACETLILGYSPSVEPGIVCDIPVEQSTTIFVGVSANLCYLNPTSCFLIPTIHLVICWHWSWRLPITCFLI